jgi:hypothetical protein
MDTQYNTICETLETQKFGLYLQNEVLTSVDFNVTEIVSEAHVDGLCAYTTLICNLFCILSKLYSKV